MAKGLKEKERQESVYKFFIFLAIILGVIVRASSKEFWSGFFAFLGGSLLAASWYYRE